MFFSISCCSNWLCFEISSLQNKRQQTKKINTERPPNVDFQSSDDVESNTENTSKQSLESSDQESSIKENVDTLSETESSDEISYVVCSLKYWNMRYMYWYVCWIRVFRCVIQISPFIEFPKWRFSQILNPIKVIWKSQECIKECLEETYPYFGHWQITKCLSSFELNCCTLWFFDGSYSILWSMKYVPVSACIRKT